MKKQLFNKQFILHEIKYELTIADVGGDKIFTLKNRKMLISGNFKFFVKELNKKMPIKEFAIIFEFLIISCES